VPFPLSVNVTPPGRAPVSERAGVGDPVLVTLNVPAAPTEKVVLAALVIAGAVCAAAPRATLAASCEVVSSGRIWRAVMT
jgi:hypothetical protein